MRLDGTFIGVEVDDAAAADAAIAAKLTEVCPVDIFSVDAGALKLVEKAIAEFPDVAQCAVVGRSDRSTCRRLMTPVAISSGASRSGSRLFDI